MKEVQRTPIGVKDRRSEGRGSMVSDRGAPYLMRTPMDLWKKQCTYVFIHNLYMYHSYAFIVYHFLFLVYKYCVYLLSFA